MLEVIKSTILFFSALFPVVNPLGGSPIFLLLSRDYSSAARDVLAWRIAINSFFLLAASFLIGTHILAFFGISLPVVQVGGGLLVMSTGWMMLNQKLEDEKQGASPSLGGSERHLQECFLSADHATDGRARLDLDSDYAWRQCPASSRHRLSRNRFGAGRLTVSRRQRVSLLRWRGAPG